MDGRMGGGTAKSGAHTGAVQPTACRRAGTRRPGIRDGVGWEDGQRAIRSRRSFPELPGVHYGAPPSAPGAPRSITDHHGPRSTTEHHGAPRSTTEITQHPRAPRDITEQNEAPRSSAAAQRSAAQSRTGSSAVSSIAMYLLRGSEVRGVVPHQAAAFRRPAARRRRGEAWKARCYLCL
eukprot:gene24996-biopygen17966